MSDVKTKGRKRTKAQVREWQKILCTCAFTKENPKPPPYHYGAHRKQRAIADGKMWMYKNGRNSRRGNLQFHYNN